MYDYIITKPELNEDTLAHYGVKGMKWRKRKGSKRILAKKKKVDYYDKENGIRRDRSRKDTSLSTGTRGETRLLTNNMTVTEYDNHGKPYTAGASGSRQIKKRRNGRYLNNK